MKQDILPNFLIVGVMKSGTSALAAYLRQHPAVWMPEHEVHFFNRDPQHARGVDAYRTTFQGWSGESAVGEKSPSYGFHPQAAARIAEMLPQVKIIWMLREPTTRAYSHYWFAASQGWEPYTFRQALAVEPRRLAANSPTFMKAHRAYFSMGNYAEQIERYLKVIPGERQCFVLAAALAHAPTATLAQICDFLEIDSTFPFVPKRGINVTHCPYSVPLQWLVTRGMARLLPQAHRLHARVRSMMQRVNLRRTPGYPPLEDDLRRELDAAYAPHNTRLAELTGLALPGWPLA